MSISLANLNRKDVVRPPRVLVYGTHGVGKNTFASAAPNPILLNIEDGQPAGLGIAVTPQIKSYEDLIAYITLIAEAEEQENQFDTVIIDSLDHFEPLVWAEAVKRNNENNTGARDWKQWSSIEDAGFGKGYQAALDVWRELLDALNWLRNDHNKSIIFIAHTEIKQFKSPEVEPFDRYGVKIHKGASELIQEWCDAVGFAHYKIATEETDAGFGNKTRRGVGGNRRIISWVEKPAFVAKNRYGLPNETNLDYQEFITHVKGS